MVLSPVFRRIKGKVRFFILLGGEQTKNKTDKLDELDQNLVPELEPGPNNSTRPAKMFSPKNLKSPSN